MIISFNSKLNTLESGSRNVENFTELQELVQIINSNFGDIIVKNRKFLKGKSKNGC